jgi:hypothetical protein
MGNCPDHPPGFPPLVRHGDDDGIFVNIQTDKPRLDRMSHGPVLPLMALSQIVPQTSRITHVTRDRLVQPSSLLA